MCFESTSHFFLNRPKRGVKIDNREKMVKFRGELQNLKKKCPNFAVNCEISGIETDATQIWPRFQRSEK